LKYIKPQARNWQPILESIFSSCIIIVSTNRKGWNSPLKNKTLSPFTKRDFLSQVTWQRSVQFVAVLAANLNSYSFLGEQKRRTIFCKARPSYGLIHCSGLLTPKPCAYAYVPTANRAASNNCTTLKRSNILHQQSFTNQTYDAT
jgi:hypothetical protein